MSDAVIKVESLGKKYLIRHEERERYTALRDVLARGLTAPLRYWRNGQKSAVSILTSDLRSLVPDLRPGPFTAMVRTC